MRLSPASRRPAAFAGAPLRHVVIAQPLALGDVVATLPLAGAIKRAWPQCRITLMTRPATRALAETSRFVDGWLDSDRAIADPRLLAALGADAFVDPFCWPALARTAQAAALPIRIGNWRRPKTFLRANRWVAVSRSHARRHTVRINLAYLGALGIEAPGELHQLYGLERRQALRAEFAQLLDPGAFNLVLHPKSGGDGREWPARHFLELVELLPAGIRLFLTGITAEREALARECPELLAHPRVVDLMGRLELPQAIALLAAVDGIVASGTGPLHIAAALGRHAIGIFPRQRNIDVERWAPIGPRAQALGLAGACPWREDSCAGQPLGPPCRCTAAIPPSRVAALIATLDRLPDELRLGVAA